MPLHKPSHPPHHDPHLPGRFPHPPEDIWAITLRSAQATERLGRAIGHQLRGGEIIALTGELGAGKTVLTKGMAAALGISPEQVTSPTFTLIHEHAGHPRLVHADLYRISHLEELRSLGFEEYSDPSTVVVIEWADRMGTELPQDCLAVHLAHAKRYHRLATVKAHGPLSRALLKRIRTEKD